MHIHTDLSVLVPAAQSNRVEKATLEDFKEADGTIRRGNSAFLVKWKECCFLTWKASLFLSHSIGGVCGGVDLAR